MQMLNHDDIVAWLKETDEKKLNNLWKMADTVRQQYVGDDVHLRGLLEISNYCSRTCAYCGINSTNKHVNRYRMSEVEILEGAKKAVDLGYGTVVIQAGEDEGIHANWMSNIVRQIKKMTPLAVTLSLGEQNLQALALWKKSGADRYLLRFETSNSTLFHLIHPPKANHDPVDRIGLLHELRALGYEIGSGVMIGIPGQSYDSLAQDILLFGELDLDMIGVGPYIPHPDTLLGSKQIAMKIDAAEQVPSDELMTYKMIALSRLICPHANIPTTTALATLNKKTGREFGLSRGANVVMPNMTPPKYRIDYEIYPNKACIMETAEQCYNCLTNRIKSIGRGIGVGPGNRISATNHSSA